MQRTGAENVDKIVRSGHGTGELAFFFGMRHLGNDSRGCYNFLLIIFGNIYETSSLQQHNQKASIHDQN